MKPGNLVGRVSYYFPLLEDYYNQRPGLILSVSAAVDYSVEPPARFNNYRVLWQDDSYPQYNIGSVVEEHEAEELELYESTLANKKKEWEDTEK